MRAGRRLQRHVRQAGDLAERALEAPHQLERALRRAPARSAGAGGRGRAAPRRARAGAGCASSCTSRAGRSPSRGRSCAARGARSGARARARRPPAAAAARGGAARAGISSSSGRSGTSRGGASNARRPGRALLEDRHGRVALHRRVVGALMTPAAAAARSAGERPAEHARRGGRCPRASAAR